MNGPRLELAVHQRRQLGQLRAALLQHPPLQPARRVLKRKIFLVVDDLRMAIEPMRGHGMRA